MDDFITLDIHPKNIVHIFASLNNAAFILEDKNGQFFKLDLRASSGSPIIPDEGWFQNNENFWQHSEGTDLGIEFVYRPRISTAYLRLFDLKNPKDFAVYYTAKVPKETPEIKITYGALYNAIQTVVEITL